MNSNPKIRGLLQALALTLYVSVFAVIIQWIGMQGLKIHPVLSIIFFLLAFIISALICGSIVFVYPVSLFFENKKSESIKVVMWTAVWLILLLAIFALVGFFAITAILV